ncbi:hypothetical protein SAMN02746089_02140 [Caldanaerobius fijiensis DSM 17918]|uniref:Uncharacterized protein n=1 Tax=Caldanaerobius fijiensis DSM 17918 TaxID=1121256 RepID=A0A1M5CKY5_9THEO|nr:hypothetical protein [Caldanaerobius fijiensis]SHF55346.1 hypothetical protein SAMN02746089_02140 [Caldanaerobius fijiensis DSM 17918]
MSIFWKRLGAGENADNGRSGKIRELEWERLHSLCKECHGMFYGHRYYDGDGEYDDF